MITARTRTCPDARTYDWAYDRADRAEAAWEKDIDATVRSTPHGGRLHDAIQRIERRHKHLMKTSAKLADMWEKLWDETSDAEEEERGGRIVEPNI
jgi:chemotaxis regulatin CheY-phosphate phosphatase CheZ